MADLGLVKQLMGQGASREQAIAAIEAVTVAAKAQLCAGKAVTFDGIGVLRSQSVDAPAPYPPGQRRTELRAKFSRGRHLIQTGEAYADPLYTPRKRSTYATRY